MDRRYDQPPRDRYMYSRPRFEERPPMRDERYFRRDDGPNRPYPHTGRYPPNSFPPSARRQHYNNGPLPPQRPHYTQERHGNYQRPYDHRHSPRRDADRLPHFSRPRDDEYKKRELKSVIASSTINSNKKQDDSESRLKEGQEAPTPMEEEKPAADESMKIDGKTQENSLGKSRVYKEAVVTFDSDGEDHVMQADWGNESDDDSVVVDRHHGQQGQVRIEREDKNEESLPESWAVHVSEKGEKYYYNKVTRETMWDKPTEEEQDKQVTIKNNNNSTGNNFDNNDITKDNSINGDSNSIKKDNENDNTKKENSNDNSVVGIKRKSVSPDRGEEGRLPKSLASRLSFPKVSSSNIEPTVLQQQSDHVRERQLPPSPPVKRVYHLNHFPHNQHHFRPPPPQHYHHDYRSGGNTNRYGNGPHPPPLPPSDRYYHHHYHQHPSQHNGGRQPWIDHRRPPPPHHQHHHSQYRHHPMDYESLPPPPPPRWVSDRRIDYDRRDVPPPPPFDRRSSRDYR